MGPQKFHAALPAPCYSFQQSSKEVQMGAGKSDAPTAQAAEGALLRCILRTGLVVQTRMSSDQGSSRQAASAPRQMLLQATKRGPT